MGGRAVVPPAAAAAVAAAAAAAAATLSLSLTSSKPVVASRSRGASNVAVLRFVNTRFTIDQLSRISEQKKIIQRMNNRSEGYYKKR